MSAVVEIWMGELAKLREKVIAKKKPFSSSRAEKEQQEVEVKQKAKKETRVHVEEETVMSETTVCLLMDRFVPCQKFVWCNVCSM
ncbi:hypothetical protein EZV62_011451 [Acer yangbiense]|uniref:Uncharacterized protein n=1 Tax=Acer yangbiense TaxID=1000413 RepID=A0A5C7I594_9ROSI|nr:hypothetical protein EZV62_011451 [Acer yangbiense]